MEIYNPLDHNFKDKRIDRWIKGEIQLAVEFIHDEKERKALERNVLGAFVIIMNNLINNSKNLPEKELREKLNSFTTEYL